MLRYPSKSTVGLVGQTDRMIKEAPLGKGNINIRNKQSRNTKLQVKTEVKSFDYRQQSQEPRTSQNYASKNGSYQKYLVSPEASTDRFQSHVQDAFQSLGSGRNTPGENQIPDEPGEWSEGSPGEDLRIVNFANSSIKGKVRVHKITKPQKVVVEPKSVALVKPQKARYGQTGGYDFYFDVIQKRRHNSIVADEEEKQRLQAQLKLPSVNGNGNGTVAVNERHVKQPLSQIQAMSYSLAIQRMYERKSSIEYPKGDSDTQAFSQPSAKGIKFANNIRIKDSSLDVVGQSVMSMQNAMDKRQGQRNQFKQVQLTQPVVFLEDRFSEQIRLRQLRQMQNRTTMQSRNNDVYSSQGHRLKVNQAKSEFRKGVKLTMKSQHVAEGFERFLEYKMGQDALEKIETKPMPPQSSKSAERVSLGVVIRQRNKQQDLQYTSKISPAGIKSMHRKLFMRKSMVEPPKSYIQGRKKVDHQEFLDGAEYLKSHAQGPSTHLVLQDGQSTENLQTNRIVSETIVTALDTFGSDKILQAKGGQEAPLVVSGQSSGSPSLPLDNQDYQLNLKPIKGPRTIAMRSMNYAKGSSLKQSGGSYFKIEPTNSKRSGSRQAEPSTLKQDDTIETKEPHGIVTSGQKMGDDLVEIGDDLDLEAETLVDYKSVKSYRKKLLNSTKKPSKLDQSKMQSQQKIHKRSITKSAFKKPLQQKSQFEGNDPILNTVQSAEQSVSSEDETLQKSLKTGIGQYFKNNLPNMIALQDKNMIDKTLESIKPKDKSKETFNDMSPQQKRRSIDLARVQIQSRETQRTKSIFSCETKSVGPFLAPRNFSSGKGEIEEDHPTEYLSDFVTQPTPQKQAEIERFMKGQDQIDLAKQRGFVSRPLLQAQRDEFHKFYSNEVKRKFMKQFMYFKRDQLMNLDEESKRQKRGSSSQESEIPDTPQARRMIMDEFIRRYKPKDIEEKPIDPRHVLIGPGQTLCRVCDADRLNDPTYLKSLSKKARAQLKSDCKCLTPQQRYDVAQGIRIVDRIIYEKEKSKKTAQQRALEAYNIESVDPKSLAPYLFCEYLKHKKRSFQMREERARIIQDLQNRQLHVLESAMTGIDKEISALTKSLQDGIEQKDIESEFDAHGGKGTFLERQVLGDMNHLEENAGKKYDVDESEEKGVKFELMEEIIGSMKHKSTTYDKIEGLKLKREALEQEKINIMNETDFHILSGFMPRAHAILSPSRVHESKEDVLNLTKIKEHQEIIPQISFQLKELIEKHKDELLSYSNVQQDKSDWCEQDIWDWIRKSYANQHKRAKGVGLDIQGIYQASLVLPLERILEDMMPVKGQIRNIGDKYFTQGNLFENEKYQQIQKLRVGDPGLVYENQTINQIFAQEIKKEKFFKQAKRGKLIPKEVSGPKSGKSKSIEAYFSQNNQAKDSNLSKQTVGESKDHEYLAQKEMQDYFDICVKHNITPILSLVAIKNHKLLYIEDNISEDEAMVIRDFLLECDIQTNPKNIVKELIIVDCGMSDECLSYILEGLRSQQYHSKVKNETYTYLETFVYKNNFFGSKSMPLLQQMMPNLFQFCMTNVDGCGQQEMAELLESIALTQKQNIQKLQISQIPIKRDIVMDKFAYIFQEKDSLCHLDISQAYMDTRAFNKMVRDVILPGKRNLKHLNLSDNKLNHQTEASSEHSREIVENLCEFFKDNEKLVYLDISGMGFSHKEGQLLKICEVISQSCDNLLAIHINDSQIRGNEDLFDEILDLFGIKSNAQRVLGTYNRPVVDPFLLQEVVQMHTNPVSQHEIDNQTDKIDLEEYKKRLILSKNSKKVQMDRLLNQLERAAGVGRQEISVDDNFILNRKVNFPELIFNQDERQDKYFVSDFSRKWQLLEPNFKNGCYVCQKHKYTIIQYDQRINQENFETFGNSDLIEICPFQVVESKSKGTFKKQRSQEQQDKVDEIKRALINEDTSRQTVPYICGTVVNGTAYSRKLKMLRLDLFSLLTVSQSHQFSDNWKQIKAIKRGIDCIVGREVEQRLFFNIGQKNPLENWDQIIHDKCFRNEITEVESINIPRQKQTLDSHNLKNISGNEFGYAAFLSPGVHNFLIYCPKTDRLFCKEVVVDLNSKDFYPDLPRMPSTNKRKTMANIWREHKQENLDKQLLIFNSILNQSEELASGSPEFFGTEDNEDELSKCSQILVEYFNQVKNLYIELAGKSTSYPQVEGVLIQDYFMRQNNSQDEQFSKPVTVKMINSSFKAITNQDLEEGSLNQGQFVELILRLTKATASCNHAQGSLNHAHASQCLPAFLQFYLLNQYESLDVVSVRNTIRESKPLNSLLLKNKLGLRRIFYEFLDNNPGEKDLSFTINSCNEIINLGVNDPKKKQEVDLVINEAMLQRAFVFSKMGLNTPKEVRQIKFVEFLEFLCRSALIISGANQQTKVEVEVQELLKKIFDYLWEKKRFADPENDPELIPQEFDDEESSDQ